MTTYSDYAPTPYDRSGALLPERQDWLVAPVSRNRDSGVLDESNFAVTVERLGGESETAEIHRFGHWACGWYEIILVHPSKAEILGWIEDAFENHPVLDEDHHAQAEHDAIEDAWSELSLRERIDFAVENGRSIFAARRGPYDCNNDAGDAVERLIVL